jgi:DNA (cytosine-5)-methyltransferase 1
MIKLGSLFAGIGGFDLGARWAFDRAGIPHEVLFQVEQNKYCQKILRKHWPDAQIFDDVCAVGRHNLPDVDILMGGFPCQDISVCGHQKGVVNGKKSSLWFEMLRIIGELRPRIAVLENVSAILRVGGPVVVGGLAEIGYNCEWKIISARQFGAPHLRKRWFCIATNTDRIGLQTKRPKQQTARPLQCRELGASISSGSIDSWQEGPPVSPICSMDDGVSDRVARLKALGNAIVPQCSEYIFEYIIKNIIEND